MYYIFELLELSDDNDNIKPYLMEIGLIEKHYKKSDLVKN